MNLMQEMVCVEGVGVKLIYQKMIHIGCIQVGQGENMDNILVSVIITTYDRPADLYRALDSVIHQTYKNLEIIVVDGKGLQETKDIVDYLSSEDDRIIYMRYRNPEKVGMYGDVQWARNAALQGATGKYVAMLDDDDYWNLNKIEQQLFHAEIHGAALTSCYMEVHDNCFTHIDKPKRLPTYVDLLKSFNMSCTSSYFLNRKIFKSIGGFDESLRSMHEYDIALKLARKGYKIIVVPEALMTRECDNINNRGFYYIKVAEIFDLYRLYGSDMLKFLGVKGFAFNVIKSSLLITIFLLGFLIKDKVWKIIFKLKEIYQEKSK